MHACCRATPQVGEAIAEAGLSKSRLESALAEIRGAGGGNNHGGRPATSDTAEGAFAALDAYGIDLTRRASKLDPVIGRDDEIRRVVRILSRCESASRHNAPAYLRISH